MNDLFEKFPEAQASKERLISKVAYQLRNAVAAIHMRSQAIDAAETLDDNKESTSELVKETRQTMPLTQQVLSLENIQGKEPDSIETDMGAIVVDLTARLGPKILNADVEFDVSIQPAVPNVKIDQTLVGEAITNLIENALQHAGPTPALIRFAAKRLNSCRNNFHRK